MYYPAVKVLDSLKRRTARNILSVLEIPLSDTAVLTGFTLAKLLEEQMRDGTFTARRQAALSLINNDYWVF